MMDNRLFQPAAAIKNFLSDSPMGEAHGNEQASTESSSSWDPDALAGICDEPADPLPFFRRGVL